jgi:hypothetical protein
MKLRKHHATGTFTSLAELELPASPTATTGLGLNIEDDNDQEVQDTFASSQSANEHSYSQKLASEREHLDWES